jgi:WD40 repeat protein
MSTSLPPDFCPYKGLQPYTEQDRAFFFGRERDQQIIISNLYAAQLTVLYGASGVGKSSVLLAGAVPLMKKEPNLAVIVFRNWQGGAFLDEIKKTTLESITRSSGRAINIDAAQPLDDFLTQACRTFRGSIFFIFDQFEEYFLYNPQSANAAGFEAEFARAVNRRDVNANFLVSMREDGLSKLDRFQGRIPALLNNMLRLEHLDRESAEKAITQPLEEYNRQSGQAPMTIEPGLVDAVLNDLTTVKVSSEQSGQGQVDQKSAANLAQAATPIETPFLQMVLTRLWDAEVAAKSRVLRLSTFESLGRAENIARTHLDTMMGRLTEPERKTAANLLRYLVTPAGTKIAQEAGALASWSDLPQAEVQTILDRLSEPDMRILRTVQTPGQPARYEIFHDVLAHAILDWRARYVQEQNQIEVEKQMVQERLQAAEQLAHQRARAKRLRLVLAALLLVTSVMIFLAIKAFRAKSLAHSRELAAYSRSQLKSDPELGLLLAIEAVKKRHTPQSIAALKELLAESQLKVVLRAGHTKAVRGVDFSPEGDHVVTASWDNTARIWEVASGKTISVLGGSAEVNSATFSNDGRYIVTAGLDGYARVWEDWHTQTPRIVATLGDGKDVWTAAFSPNGEFILTGGANGKVSVWEWRKAPAELKSELVFAGATAPAPTPTPTPTVAGTPPNTAAVPSAGPTRIVHIFKAVFSPDGAFIIIAAKDKTPLIWEWRKPKGDSNPLALRGHRFAVYDAAFSEDGNFAVTASDDKTVCVWDWKQAEGRAKPKTVLNLLPNSVRGVAFSPDGNLVATASDDGLARLWQWRVSDKVDDTTELRGGNKGIMFCVAFSHDGHFLITGSEDGTARVWRTDKIPTKTLDALSIDDLLKLAGTRATRQLTPEEKANYLDE